MTPRIRRTADFERLLGAPAICRSTHFSLHHVAEAPIGNRQGRVEAGSAKLSTGTPTNCPQAVEDSGRPGPNRWLGLIVPKRILRDATTRNLIRRQAREAFRCHAERLSRGMWLLRVRQGFDRRAYRSATSRALAAAARGELDSLLRRAAR